MTIGKPKVEKVGRIRRQRAQFSGVRAFSHEREIFRLHVCFAQSSPLSRVASPAVIDD